MLEQVRSYGMVFWEQSKAFYGGLTVGRKITFGVVLLTLLFALSAVFFYKPTASFEVAYSNLSPEDKTSILAEFKKNNVKDFQLEGDTLSFPQEKSLEYKMLLAQEGLPSTGTGVGWEKFDEHTFGLSDFDQKINKMRALQGELARTIGKLDPVDTCRVHIVMGDDGVFSGDKKPPTASIYLRLKSGKTLNQRQVQGVLYLVAHAVEGLEPKDITIVDQQGNMLTQVEEDDGGLDKVTTTQREYQKKLEKELEQKIKDIIVRIVGHNKIVSKVQASVDFKKVEETISDVDPERTAVISSQRNEQSSEGTGLNPTGVPGAKSNLPGEQQSLTAGGGPSNSSKSSTENLNYDVKKTVSKIIEPVGNIVKLNASVLVDGKTVDGKFVPRSKEEMEMITKLVKNAIGFQEGRDFLTVETAPFEPDEFALAEKDDNTARQFSLIKTLALSVLGIATMFFIYYALVRPYFRWLTFDPEKRSKEQLGLLEYDFERSNAASKRVERQEDIPFEKLPVKEQIMYLAKNDPKKTTEAIRQLLHPH